MRAWRYSSFIGGLVFLVGSVSQCLPRVFDSNPTRTTNDYDYWGRCSNERLELEKRVENCLGMMRMQGTNSAALAQIGRAYMKAGEFKGAEDAYNQAIQWNENHDFRFKGNRDFEALEGRDEILVLEGRYDTAIANAVKFISDNPDASESYDHRCWLRAIGGKELDAALADCNEALDKDSRNASALDSRGLVEFKLGQLDKAKADYNAALDLESRIPSSLFMRGVIKSKNGDEAGGNDDIALAKQLDPTIAQEFTMYGVVP